MVYASLLHMPDEVEYIWRQKITLPTILYAFSKYPIFFLFSFTLIGDLLPAAASVCLKVFPLFKLSNYIEVLTVFVHDYPQLHGLTLSLSSLCNDLGHSGSSIAILIVIGAQAESFIILNLVDNIGLLLSDVLAFIAVIYQVGGLWKSKRRFGLQTNGDLVTLLLRQVNLREIQAAESTIVPIQNVYELFYQNTHPKLTSYPRLSSLLICEFTLDLRRWNRQRSAPNQSALELPTLSFQENPAQAVLTIFGRLRESIITEMGDRNDLVELDLDSSISLE
ncbi:hypothetical protein Clacol_007831 [Clathrus columnatus]|uniref:DUF6533 domain-containing protein n=1 Tax=Clathrus columnatus TaxID=1419009 RepID=A0AAV5AGU0_9AGAM|nr:hypothetical protein Clacol_007831 [Clathrus columnatus]